ncbi:MAG: hypothetical protein EOP04_23535 [Proteobacteria bacterium]|nr:MAG: hypothetical protein EOP04_23535 [Pseudomonadota bacterium]
MIHAAITTAAFSAVYFRSRFQRWIYHGLHSLDFGFLVYKRPLWDVVVLLLMLGGTCVSTTGLILTWTWLRRKGRKLIKTSKKAILQRTKLQAKYP